MSQLKVELGFAAIILKPLLYKRNQAIFQKQVQGNGGIRLKNLAFATGAKSAKNQQQWGYNYCLLPIPHSLSSPKDFFSKPELEMHLTHLTHNMRW